MAHGGYVKGAGTLCIGENAGGFIVPPQFVEQIKKTVTGTIAMDRPLTLKEAHAFRSAWRSANCFDGGFARTNRLFGAAINESGEAI